MYVATIVSAAAEHGAQFIWDGVLRLGPGIDEYYLPFLEREFPDLVTRYRRLYRGQNAAYRYVESVRECVAGIKAARGFVDAPDDDERRSIAQQLSLFG